MLIRRVLRGGERLPYFNSSGAAANNPRTKYEELLDGLLQIRGELQLVNLLASLEYPDALFLAFNRSSPRGEDRLLPCGRSCDIRKRLRPGQEDEIEAAPEVVCLQASSY